MRSKFQSVNHDFFGQAFLEVLNERAPVKKKFFPADHVPCLTNSLRQTIMIIFLQDNFYSKLYKKEQKNISKRLELNKVIMKDFGEL